MTADEIVKIGLYRTDTGEKIHAIETRVPKGTRAKYIQDLKRSHAERLRIPISKIKVVVHKPPISERQSVTVSLNSLKRNVIWDALYGARAQGRNSDKPDWVFAREQIMDAMLVTDTYRNRVVIQKELPSSVTIKVTLNGLKRNVIWDSLYAARASGRNSGKPDWELAGEQIMDAMRLI